MELAQKLNYHYKVFDKSKLSPDPLQFLHFYKNDLDIEVMGLIASIFSFGNMKQIINSLEKIRSIVGENPHKYIINFSTKNYENFQNLKHRFYKESDILNLFLALRRVYVTQGSLKNLFLTFYDSSEPKLKNAISKFSDHFLNEIKKQTHSNNASRGIQFMFSKLEKGSACKRMNLFLRWMVRKDELDFGLWKEIPTSKLIIPVDTHIAKICKSLKLTKRKNVSWKMAEEITENLKKYDSFDPVKYDFALCHIGMRKLKF
jgi:uncharacterized protein (TIGR02757 family)